MKIGISIDNQTLNSYVAKTAHKELYRTSEITPTSYPALLMTIENLTKNIQIIYGKTKSLGISLCENFSYNNQTCQHIAKKLIQDIQVHTGLKCTVVTHSQSATLAEAFRVKPYKHCKILGAYLDHSCGVEIVENRTIKHIYQHDDYSWAHSTLPDFNSITDGLTPVCRCGKEVCIEQFVTVEGIERQYHQLVLKDLPLRDIYSEIDRFNNHATRIYRTFLDQLARALASLVNVYKPSHVVLFGAATHYHSLNKDLTLALTRYCDISVVPLVALSQLDNFAYAQGASLL